MVFGLSRLRSHTLLSNSCYFSLGLFSSVSEFVAFELGKVEHEGRLVIASINDPAPSNSVLLRALKLRADCLAWLACAMHAVELE